MQPSIDTMLVSYAIANLFKEGHHSFSSVLDVGSGSGFIGKFAAMHAPGEGPVSVTLSDIDPTAAKYCKSPMFGAKASSLVGRGLSWQFHAGDSVKLLDEKSGDFDLIVSNPPYIPTSKEVMQSNGLSTMASFWEGCGLLVHLIDLMLEGRYANGAHLILGLTSLTLKSQCVCRSLAQARSRGVTVKILVEREIAWKAWYAGRGSSPSYLLATESEYRARQLIGDCEFFVGATEPGHSRLGGVRDSRWGYHWHYAYVLDIYRTPP